MTIRTYIKCLLKTEFKTTTEEMPVNELHQTLPGSYEQDHYDDRRSHHSDDYGYDDRFSESRRGSSGRRSPPPRRR